MGDEDLVARTLRLPSELAAWLRLKAVTAGMSENSYVKRLIEADRDASRASGKTDAEIRAAAVQHMLRRYNLDPDSPDYQAAAAAARADVRGPAQGAA